MALSADRRSTAKHFSPFRLHLSWLQTWKGYCCRQSACCLPDDIVMGVQAERPDELQEHAAQVKHVDSQRVRDVDQHDRLVGLAGEDVEACARYLQGTGMLCGSTFREMLSTGGCTVALGHSCQGSSSPSGKLCCSHRGRLTRQDSILFATLHHEHHTELPTQAPAHHAYGA